MKVKNMIYGIILIVIGIFIDQITKYIILTKFQDKGTIKAIKNVMNITYVENTGGAFGFMSGNRWLFILITIFALGIFGYLIKDFDLKVRPIYSASLILIIIGTLGNFIDRITRGYVVDFIQFAFWKSFAVFNFADICITVGVAFIMGGIIFGDTVNI